MGAAAAIAGGVAVAGLAGSMISSNAAGKAASTQAAAADRATAASQAEAAQTRADLAPYNQFGQSSANRLADLNGSNGSEAQLAAFRSYGMSGPTFNPTQFDLEQTPGYQFDLSQGLKSVASSNAAKGLGVSGAALKGAAQYATGLADNTLKTQQGIFQQNYANIMNPLQSGAALGESAAAQTGALGTQNTANANNAAMAGANASASGMVGSANALAGGLNSVGNAGQNYLLMNRLFPSGGDGGSGAVSGGNWGD